MLPERFGDLERTMGRLFRTVMEDQRHPVAGRQPHELFVGRVAHLRGCARFPRLRHDADHDGIGERNGRGKFPRRRRLSRGKRSRPRDRIGGGLVSLRGLGFGVSVQILTNRCSASRRDPSRVQPGVISSLHSFSPHSYLLKIVRICTLGLHCFFGQ